MINTYFIVVAKDNKKTPEVAEYLKRVFSHSWRVSVNKDSEVWLCGRQAPVNVSDTVSAIKTLNKKIMGVMINRVFIAECCFDKEGVFNVNVEGETPEHPSSMKLMDVFMGK
jgi:hypothetical protein